MILESRDFDVFGVVRADGCKDPGLLEKMGIPAQPIVRYSLIVHYCQIIL